MLNIIKIANSNVVNERNLGRAIERQKQAKKNYDAIFILPKREREQHHFQPVQLY